VGIRSWQTLTVSTTIVRGRNNKALEATGEAAAALLM
jgi:hypothetical protein